VEDGYSNGPQPDSPRRLPQREGGKFLGNRENEKPGNSLRPPSGREEGGKSVRPCPRGKNLEKMEGPLREHRGGRRNKKNPEGLREIAQHRETPCAKSPRSNVWGDLQGGDGGEQGGHARGTSAATFR